VLGLLFALLAPFPDRRTRLGAAWDRFLDKRFPKRTAPERPDPFVAALAGDRPAAASTPAPADDNPADSNVAVAQPTRSIDLDDDSEPLIEAEERPSPSSETGPGPQSKLEPKFEDESHDENDHIRDGKPGDVKPY
jgi:hypothetical protein